MDAPFQQCDNLNLALERQHRGNEAAAFPGEYEAVNLPLLTKYIVIGL